MDTEELDAIRERYRELPYTSPSLDDVKELLEDVKALLDEAERLRAALEICHGTLSELMAGPFAPASSRGNYALTLCIDTAAEALGK